MQEVDCPAVSPLFLVTVSRNLHRSTDHVISTSVEAMVVVVEEMDLMATMVNRAIKVDIIMAENKKMIKFSITDSITILVSVMINIMMITVVSANRPATSTTNNNTKITTISTIPTKDSPSIMVVVVVVVGITLLPVVTGNAIIIAMHYPTLTIIVKNSSVTAQVLEFIEWPILKLYPCKPYSITHSPSTHSLISDYGDKLPSNKLTTMFQIQAIDTIKSGKISNEIDTFMANETFENGLVR